MTSWLQTLAFIGEWLSGLAASIAVVFAILAVTKTIPHELAKFRATKREEKRAEVAEKVWSGAFRFALTLRAMIDQSAPTAKEDTDEEGIPKKESQKFFDAYSDRYKLLLEASNALLDLWGLAKLHLDASVSDALDRFWKVRADILTNFNMYAMSLDGKGVPLVEAHEKLFGQGTATSIDRREEELRAVLEPIARFDAKTELKTRYGPG
jgi:hypothetical protein